DSVPRVEDSRGATLPGAAGVAGHARCGGSGLGAVAAQGLGRDRSHPQGGSVKRCSVPGCDRKHWARGMCRAHYGRWWRTGEASGTIESRPSARIFAGESSWTPMPLAFLPDRPVSVTRLLADLAERAAREGMTTTQYEREQARILGGQA